MIVSRERKRQRRPLVKIQRTRRATTRCVRRFLLAGLSRRTRNPNRQHHRSQCRHNKQRQNRDARMSANYKTRCTH